MLSVFELLLYSWKSYAQHSDNRLTTGLQVLTLGALAWRMLGGGTRAIGVFLRRSPALLSVIYRHANRTAAYSLERELLKRRQACISSQCTVFHMEHNIAA